MGSLDSYAALVYATEVLESILYNRFWHKLFIIKYIRAQYSREIRWVCFLVSVFLGWLKFVLEYLVCLFSVCLCLAFRCLPVGWILKFTVQSVLAELSTVTTWLWGGGLLLVDIFDSHIHCWYNLMFGVNLYKFVVYIQEWPLRWRLKLIVMISLSIHMMTSQDHICVQFETAQTTA